MLLLGKSVFFSLVYHLLNWKLCSCDHCLEKFIKFNVLILSAVENVSLTIDAHNCWQICDAIVITWPHFIKYRAVEPIKLDLIKFELFDHVYCLLDTHLFIINEHHYELSLIRQHFLVFCDCLIQFLQELRGQNIVRIS